VREAEIRRIVIRGQPRLKKKFVSLHLEGRKLDVEVRAHYPSNSGKHKLGGLEVQADLGKKQDPISKMTRAKRTWIVA
jgi:hypothetical protein